MGVGRRRQAAWQMGEKQVTSPGQEALGGDVTRREAAGGQGPVPCGGWAAKRCGGQRRPPRLGFGEVLLWSDGEDQVWGEAGDWAILI